MLFFRIKIINTRCFVKCGKKKNQIAWCMQPTSKKKKNENKKQVAFISPNESLSFSLQTPGGSSPKTIVSCL